MKRRLALLLLLIVAGCGSPGSDASLSEARVFGPSFDIQVLAATDRGELYAAGTVIPWLPPAFPSVFRSDDGGERWTRSIGPEAKRGEVFEGFTGLAADPSGATVFLTAAVGRWPSGYLEGVVFRSDDRGRSWTRIAAPDGNPYISSVVVGRGGKAYVYTCDGLYRSDDRGQSWVFTGLYRHRILFFKPDACYTVALGRVAADSEGHVYAPAAGPEGEGIYRSVDGERWSRLPLPLVRQPYFVAANSKRGVVVTARFKGRQWLFVSGDAGSSWDQVAGPEEAGWGGATDLAIGEDGALYVETTGSLFRSGGLFRSSDGGRTWRRLPALPLPPLPARTRPIVIGHDNRLYIGIGVEPHKSSLGQLGGLIVYALDRGETWRTMRVLERLDEPLGRKDGGRGPGTG